MTTQPADGLESLAQRVEALTGHCRETDEAIAKVVGSNHRTGPIHPRIAPQGYYAGPAYTASLDAAMTLVPEAWRLRQINFSAPCADDRKWHLNLHGGREGEDTFVGRSATPALALLAAALRSRLLAPSERG